MLHLFARSGSWASLGRSWAAFGRSWPLWGSSWAALGRSWEALGRLLGGSWPLLAALGAILERHAKIIKKSMPKMTDFGSQKGAQREPKSDPKPTKIEDKNRCEKNTSSRSSWSRLGAILGHFGSPLGVIFVDFALVFKGFRENSRFSKKYRFKSRLEPNLAHLGSILASQKAPRWVPKATKNDQKTC